MDVSAEFSIPNPFGLLASEFTYDMDSYRACLAFLSDLAGGSDHDTALAENGGSRALLTRWKGIPKFRVVYQKCVRAAEVERRELAEIEARKAAEAEKSAATVDTGQRFIPMDEIPLYRSTFRPRF